MNHMSRSLEWSYYLKVKDLCKIVDPAHAAYIYFFVISSYVKIWLSNEGLNSVS